MLLLEQSLYGKMARVESKRFNCAKGARAYF